MFNYIRRIIPDQQSRRWFWFVMIVLLSFYPYKLANAYFPFWVSNIQTIFLTTVILIGCVVISENQISLPRPLNLIVWVMVIGCLFSFFITGHKYYYHKLIIMTGGVMLILIVNAKIGLNEFYTIYNRWILIMAILGVLGFLIAMIGIAPITVFEATEDYRPVSSWLITFSKQITPGAGFIRYAGFFDEPGAMGYWGVFALAINKLFIHDKNVEKYLLVCLLFTFSMGYYTQIAIYLLLTTLGEHESSKKKLAWILFVIVALSAMYATEGTQFDIIYKETIGRFEKASEGDEFMAGTSRERLTKDSKEVFERNPWLGIGWPVDNIQYLGDNPYETLAHDGIIGTLYLYFPFLLLLYWSIKRKDYMLFSMTLFMVAGFMHRPFHFNYLTFFIFYSIPLMYYQDKIKGSQYYIQEVTYIK